MWTEERLSNKEIADNLAQLGIPSSERSIRRAKNRWGIGENTIEKPSPAGMDLRGDEGDVTSEVSEKLKTPEQLMEDRGLDPEEWEVLHITINEWDGPIKGGGKQPLKQLKINIRRKVLLELVVPARIDGPVFKAGYRRRTPETPRRVVLVGDQQAPYHDKALHEIFCHFLDDYDADEGVLIGDTIDFPDISRHPNNPEKDCTVQDCIDSGYNILRQYREVDSDVEWMKLAGNHDERLRRYQIDKVERLYRLRRAQVPGEEPELPALDVGHLMRLDELGVEYIRPEGDYEHTQVNLSTHLAARHGWIARKGSGTSALATLEQLGYSIVVGHTHRQSLVHKTRHDINGDTSTLAACETGCMCKIDGLGYTVAPDWQNGFATASIWDDGTFKLDLATYVNGTLYYRDRQYK